MNKVERSITRDDVAREAGVSPATVSYVINNGPRPVSPETRQRVMVAIEKLGYKPNVVARSLRMRKTTTLGLILPDTHNPYFAEVIRGVEKVAYERGYSVVLCHSDYSSEREVHYADVLQSRRVAGVLWFPATVEMKPAELLTSYGVPLVMLDRMMKGVEVPVVLANNYRGGYLAVKHLIELGHRRIGCIARPVDLYHSSERVRGYTAALQENGLAVEEGYIIRGGFQLEDGRRAAFNLLNLEKKPTAIFAYNDFMAIGAMRACFEMGLSVPGEISIVGFDDIPQAAYTCPALTTVRQPKLEMGRRGAELLFNLIEGNMGEGVSPPLLDIELIVRESTGKMKG